MEGATAADRIKHNGDSFSTKRVDDGPKRLTSFGKLAEPSLAPEKRIGDTLVDKGAEVPKPYLPPVTRSTTGGGGGVIILSTFWEGTVQK